VNFNFENLKSDSKSKARLGKIITPHGVISTPAFSPVATRASVKTLSPDDLMLTKSQVILANTYHLYLRPGNETIKKFGGFAQFMGWNGPTITDSGGYQVSFLWTPNGSDEDSARVVRITDSGATFKSHIDGSLHQLTPEKSMKIQYDLGADIIMAFDQPLAHDASAKLKKDAFTRTLKWEERSFIAWKKLEETRKSGSYQALFGIIQGEDEKKLRQQSLKFLLDLDFPGLAIGGKSVGSDPKMTARALDTIADILPSDKPLHALGLGGGPEGIITAVDRGVDIFDNTGITRMARTGLLFLHPKDGGNCVNKFRTDIKKSMYKEMNKPLSKVCQCYTCTNFSSAYLHHLMVSGEVLGLRLATIHNIYFINNLMEEIRKSIAAGNYSGLKKHWLSS
jgi:queuine tRNA-ribosyltransferase